MDFLVGLIFWGGLLLLTLSWIARTGLTGRRSAGGSHVARTPPSRPAAPPRPAPRHRVRPDDLQQMREDEALADGLVIGHFLTRDHYRDRIDGLEDDLDSITDDRDRWRESAAAGDDLEDVLDDAEFDALGGLGVEPWADELFDED